MVSRSTPEYCSLSVNAVGDVPAWFVGVGWYSPEHCQDIVCESAVARDHSQYTVEVTVFWRLRVHSHKQHAHKLAQDR